ncbi:hypothetical protein AX16_006049 [Volvariella volvacea WC 439]|nr:hypothetical protein AX16_006049 [Volvariella volvacea WC 439]
MSELKTILEGHPADIPTNRGEILRCIAILEEEQRRLENTSKVLSQLMDTVDAQHQNVYRTSVLYNSRLVPINRLSSEILQEILRYCYPPSEMWHNFWVFEQVSRRWRHVALGCVELWSYLHINRYSLERYRARYPLVMIDRWLRRSAQSALHIDFQAFDHTQYNSLSSSMFILLLRDCQRWKTLNLRFFNNIDAGILAALETIRGRFLLLQSVQIHVSGSNVAPGATIQAFSYAPRLSRLVLNCQHHLRTNISSYSITSLSIDDSRALTSIALPHLQDLGVEGCLKADTFSNVVEFIRRSGCTNLKSLRTYYVSSDRTLCWAGGEEEVFRLLPSLESLKLGADRKEIFHGVLPYLLVSDQNTHLPNLRKLAICTCFRSQKAGLNMTPLLVEVLEGRRQNGTTANIEVFIWEGLDIDMMLEPFQVRMKQLEDDGLAIILARGALLPGFTASDNPGSFDEDEEGDEEGDESEEEDEEDWDGSEDEDIENGDEEEGGSDSG